jgi:preprotein translocase subunit YajC
MGKNDFLLIGMVIIFGGFMYFNGRKRKTQAADLASRVVVGANIMLTSGIYGVIVSLGDARAVIKTADATLLEVDKRAISRVVEEASTPIAKTVKTPAKKPAAKK